MFKSLYEYRELLKENVKKGVRGKYKGSFLGILWSFVNPLLSSLVYALVFPFVLKTTQENYVTFLIIGILPWNFFTSVINQGTLCILSNAGVIKKVYFPREILPISETTSGLINFLISFLIIFIFLIFSGIGLSKYVLYLPLVVLIQYVFTLAIVFITSSINVYIRDLAYIITVILQILFYVTPIVYSSDVFAGSKISWLINLNPMTIIINGYRDILYYQVRPNIIALILATIGSILLLFISIKVFKKLEKGFAEEV